MRNATSIESAVQHSEPRISACTSWGLRLGETPGEPNCMNRKATILICDFCGRCSNLDSTGFAADCHSLAKSRRVAPAQLVAHRM